MKRPTYYILLNNCPVCGLLMQVYFDFNRWKVACLDESCISLNKEYNHPEDIIEDGFFIAKKEVESKQLSIF